MLCKIVIRLSAVVYKILSTSHQPSFRQDTYVGTLLMIGALCNTDEHRCHRYPALTCMWLYEANRDVCRRSALGCSELPSKCTLEFSNTEVITYKTKIKNKTRVARPEIKTKDQDQDQD